MEFQDSYFEDEVRDGFYVPAMMKRAWAAELEVLSEIDRICKKHQIPYFAEWGSLLGTVRHKGFVPWDDDLDISMKRKDYERFLKVADKELPEGFAVYNYDRHDDFWYFLARVVGKTRICFEEDHLERFHEFPYICGVDIFVLDYVSSDEEKEAYRKKMAEFVLTVADSLENGKLKGRQLKESLKMIEENCKVSINKNQQPKELKKELYRLTERLFAAFSEEESECLTQMMPCGLYGNTFYLPKEYYQKALIFPFENTTMPVPVAYDGMLRKRYGEYMMLVRNSGSHGYPFFETQHKKLEAVLDFELPKFKFSIEDAQREQKISSMTYKKIIENDCGELEDLYAKLQDGLKNWEAQESIKETVLQLLADHQRVVIDMGNTIEEYKGEGMEVIPYIESFCEWIYQIYEAVSQGMAQSISEYMEKLSSDWNRIKEEVKKILVRKEIVFLPFKADYWKFMEGAWKTAMEDALCDVSVIPLPYYYKKYDGTFRSMHSDRESYPQNVKTEDYESFDLKLHHPDEIVFQNPYDEYHDSISVPPQFYSSNLKSFTEKLVYIPYFELEEFTKENEREYFNMKYYCCVPGVVRADQVIVQSEEMKDLYIEKLEEFAGESTKEIWEKKIFSLESQKGDKVENVHKEDLQLPEAWKKIIFGEKTKKVMLFYVGVSLFIQDRQKMINKLKNVLQIFYENKEDIALLWKAEPLIKMTLKEIDKQTYHQYVQIEEQYKKEGWGIFDDSGMEERELLLCDAYYGDASPIVQNCRNKSVPVMILNDDV